MLDFCYHSAKAKCKTDKDCDKYERCDRNSICGKYRFTICVVPFNKFFYIFIFIYIYIYVCIHTCRAPCEHRKTICRRGNDKNNRVTLKR